MMRCSNLPTRLARTGCSVLALATALVVGASPAAAQSFLGTGTYATNPNATGITTGPSSTTINLNGGQTVIDWVPNDNAMGGGPINFQLGGTTATFTGASDFAVLNNINQADMGRVISMNGTINSLVGGVPGGSVYFYSAGGFVLGANSLINVGSLVLSASPITLVGGNFINGASNTVVFGQATNPLAGIVTSSGTQINAMAGDAYVAMVAPRVQHGGTITVNGSAALVGAEAATIDFSPDGLFDIQVTVGTTDSQGVFTNGDITGSASAGAGDARRAFLVAVPKNTALTMAISNGADLGFQIAGAANVSGNAVILSAGHDIVDGEVGAISAGSVPGTLANINSVGLNATSAVRAVATNFAEFYGGAGQANSFASDLNIRAPGRAWLSTFGTGSSVTIGNDLVLNSDRIATIAGGSATGGSAFLYTGDNGAITVGRDATVTANGSGSGSSTAGIAGGAGTGGSAGIQNQAAGGTISIVRNALVSASGTGGGGLVADSNGGAGAGGFATIRSYASGTSLTVGGTATAQALGTGGSGLGCATCFGGVGNGGYVLADVQLGSTLSVTGLLHLNADGRGGSRAFGRGGTIDMLAGTNSSLTAGTLKASADGYGGADGGAGAGNGTGGTARLIANGTEATIAISNIVTTGTLNERDMISVEGRGGQTNGGGSGIGGSGQGGNALIQGSAGGSITLPNTADPVGVRVMVRGYGGNASASGTTGGLGAAGSLNLSFDNGTFTAGPLHLSAAGLGGNATGEGDITGGNGVGGTRNVTALNGSTLSFAISGGVSGGGGGDGAGTGNGGNATGGFASLLVDNSTVNFTSRSNLVTQNQGGTGASGGNGTGGTSNVTIRNGGIVNVADDPSPGFDLAIGTFSYGNTGATGNGGNATAGSTTLNLQGGTINLTGTLLVGSEAYGGEASTSGTGGSATGGTVNANATGANNAITGQGTATFSTNAFGGFSATGTGGNATGGTTNLGTNSGASLAIASSAVVTATGFGGAGGTAGGGGFGGTARIFANSGSSLSIGGLASIEADGKGGGDDDLNGNGGFGDGGLAVVSSAGGAISLSNVNVRAAATGGSVLNGLGGGALGGSARLAANGGSISVSGDVTVTASATGGSGSTGGNATALVSTMNESTPAAVALYANTGGSLTINGDASLDGRATGGQGSNGNGGNAIAGEADVVAFVGAINVGDLSIDVSGQGGAGGNGGNGGSGRGGEADVAFGLDTPVINGTITLGTATISADGFGGNGGTGLNNNFGGNGGAGGAGTGGGILFVGSAAGGTLDSGTALLTARGTGGQGGAGGNGDSGTGGNGGAGGAGTGNFIQTGTVSQNLSPGSGGAAKFTTLSIDTSATGGNGGNGGQGGGGNGAGGSGGAAAGGRSDFLIRGVLGTANSVNLLANATGGDGGLGAVAGNGGNARTGFILVESKDRFEVPAERGTLIANSIVGSATAIGGSGATPGTSTVMNGSYFRVLNGDANVGTVSITLSGILNDSTFGPSFVSVRDGTATTGSFSFVTNGTLALDANSGSMRAGSFTLSAADFVPHVLDPAPTNIGTYFSNSATITTGNNFVTNADLDIGGNLTIVAPGLIDAHDFTIDGDLDLSAGSGGITAKDLDVTGAVNLNAFGAIALNLVQAGFFYANAGTFFTSDDITSETNIQIDSGTGTTVGDLVAGVSIDEQSDKAVRLNSGGSIVMGNVTAKGGIDFDAEESVTGENLTSGVFVGGSAGGPIILGDLSGGLVDPQGLDPDGYSVGISSGTSISVGNVEGLQTIGFASAGALTTGDIAAQGDVLALAGGDMQFGAISADGRVYLAGYSMFLAAMGDNDGDDFDAQLVFNAVPVATGGSITVGAIDAGRFEAAAGTTLTGTTIDSNRLLYATSGGNMALGGLSAGNDVRLTSGGNIIAGDILVDDDVMLAATGSIKTNNIVAFDDVRANAGTTLTTDDITGNSIDLFAGGSIDTGNLTTRDLFFEIGALALVAGTSITVQSAGNASVGNIDALDGVHVSADGSISAGTIEADDFVELYAGGNIAAGTINAGSYIDVFSDTGLLDLDNLHADTEIDLETSGSLLFGDVTADDFNFEIGGSVGGGNIDVITHADGHAEGAIVLENINVTGPPNDGDFSVGFTSTTSITVENVDGFGRVGFATPGNLTTGNLTAGSLVMTLVGGNIVTGSITTDGDGTVYMADSSMFETGGGLEEDGDFDASIVLALPPVPTTGSILINGPVTTGLFQAAAGTSLASGAIDAGSRVELSSGGAMQLLDVTAGTSMKLTSGAALSSGHLTAGSLMEISAVGAVAVGNIIIDGGIQALDVGPGTPVEMFGASITTGNISTDGYVGLYTPGDLTVGTINAGHDVIALVGDDSNFGAITTPERFFLGGYEMFALVTGGEGFNPEAVFAAAEKSSTDGSANFAGSSSASSFEAYVGDNTTIASLRTANFADIDTGGLFTLTGALNGFSRVISNDIDIGANASVNNGEIYLVSRNPTQTLIGDGLDGLGQGYRLSDAEADRIHTEFSIAADTSYGAAAKMIIGDLSITAADDGGDDVEYDFETINGDSDDQSVGLIKVVGDVVFTGLGEFDEVSFDSNLFQLDAATGSISLFSQGTTLGGELGIYAPDIWVASGDILAKLEVNPRYSGYVAELNAPAAVQRPEGVLRAASLDLGSDEDDGPRSLLVQNTGTKETPAGFVITESGLDDDGDDGDDGDSDTAPGSINLVINGQIITQTGTLTGIAVRDRLVMSDIDTADFAAGSTINGCPLTGTCQTEQPRVVTPTPTDVALSGNGGLGDGSFGNEADIDDGESGDEGDKSSPIAPPNPLFDSRPLSDSADIDDPVSGSGNPSLYGSPEDGGGVGGSEDDEDDEDDEDNEDNEDKKKKAKQGDGK